MIYEYGEPRLKYIIREKPKNSKILFIATLCTTNPTWSDLGANPGLRGSRPETKRLSYGTA
jgi:hypothetical protein